jgi:ribonucleotide monophosphatase NagD (HAD superfamily)
VVGKPARASSERCSARWGRTRRHGDGRREIESDIGGAMRAGLRSVRVRTGKFREDRMRESGIEPTAVIDSIAALPDLLAC